jgi:D-3-phosphoglycerate dehydrogenase / 2-oxoglutarate reductase
MRLQIVATDSVPPAADDAFADLGAISLDDGRDPELLPAAEVLIVRTRTVDRALLQRASRLRVIARTGVGLDGIDLGEASRRGLPVVYAPDAGTVPIAEGTLALIFATSKRLMELNAVLVEGRWHHRYGQDIRDLAGSTLGIVGLGRIGSEVARLAHALGMRVIGHDPRELDPITEQDLSFVERVSLEQLIGAADIVTLHCGLNETSRGMINRELLARTKPGAILINASRGGLIAGDNLLLEALECGWLSAIGLDVFGREPPDSDSPLLRDRRVVSTPHAIGLTRAWNERVFTSLANDVRSLVNGRTPRFIANPEILAVASLTNGASQIDRL